MKERTIILPLYEKDEIEKRVEIITKIVGAKNVCSCRLNYAIPEITVRCSKKQWKELRFKLCLVKTYWG